MDNGLITALFDSDGTLYSNQQGRGMLEYLESHGHHSQAAGYLRFFVLLRLLHQLGWISLERFQQITTIRLGRLVKGQSEPEAAAMFDWVAGEYLLPSQRQETAGRLREHQAGGYRVVIISAMFTPCLKRIAEYFDVKDFIGTELESRDGIYTGRIIPPLVSGQVKAEAARRFFAAHTWPVNWEASYAYGDSSTDRYLLGLVGHPRAVYPDRKLYELALERKWDILGTPKS